ncbi:MAG: hypothetical protein J6W75_10030 [Bacteroidaceae bacterium]|nr:hypothetical protein [Bacteroidaceae bacterium]
MKEIPFIVTELVLKAVQHLQDAKYDHQAEVVIGEKSRTFVLVEEEEFKELIDFLDEERGWEEFPRDFNAIVKTPHWSTEEEEGS